MLAPHGEVVWSELVAVGSVVRGSPVIEVMVLLSASEGLILSGSPDEIQNARPRQIQVAGAMVLSGISDKPLLDLIASIIPSGFIESLRIP